MKRTSIALVLSTLALTSCVVISTDGDKEISGQYVSATTLEQIKIGSTQEYVASLINEPTTRTTLSDGTEIWKWSHEETSRSSSHLLFLVNTSKRTNDRHNAYVQFEHGLVTKTWRD